MIIKLEKYLKNSDVDHYFFISSPIVEILAYQFISKYKISNEKIKVINYRNYTPVLLSHDLLFCRQSFLERVALKVFQMSWEGIKLKIKITSSGKKFLLYLAWDFPAAVELMSSKNCLGHVYLEEGQMSYVSQDLYKRPENMMERKRQIQQWRNSNKKLTTKSDRGEYNDFYSKDALAFVKLFKEAFPEIPECKQILVDDFSHIIKNYKPQLLGVRYLGIMCAPRRLSPDNVLNVVNALISHLPEGGFIKLHPDFNRLPELRKQIVDHVNSLTDRQVDICRDTVIIELEMILEKKILYGSKTSLVRYTRALGSIFNEVKLY
jgi:hypothetical protein